MRVKAEKLVINVVYESKPRLNDPIMLDVLDVLQAQNGKIQWLMRRKHGITILFLSIIR